MSELSFHQAERMPPQQSAEIIHSVHQAVYEDIPAQQTALQTVIETACSNAISSEEQRTFAAAGGVIDWLLFADRGDPLPPGLIKVRLDQGDIVSNDLRLDPNLFDKYSWSNIIAICKNYGLKELLELRANQRQQHETELRAGMDEALRASPMYQFLQSFGVDKPPNSQQAPLTRAQRMLRESQIRAEIRDMHGLAPQDPINHMTPAADISLRQRVVGLEDETRPQHPGFSFNTQTPYDRVRRYFTDLMMAHFSSDPNFAGIKADTLVFDGSESALFIQPEGVDLNSLPEATWRSRFPYLTNGEATLAEDACFQLLGQRGYYTVEANEDLCESAISFLFDGQPLPHDYQAFLDTVVNHTIEELGFLELYWNGKRDELEWALETGAWLKEPSGPIFFYRDKWGEQDYQDEVKRKASSRLDIESPSWLFVSEDRAESSKEREWGNISVAPSVGQKMRLIQRGPRTEGLPAHIDNPAIVIEAVKASMRGQDPYIPGFALAARYEKSGVCHYAFLKAESDPYAACAVPIPSDKIIILAGQYRSIGLSGLAEAVEKKSGLTVDALANLLQKHSVYHMAAGTSGIEANAVEDFMPWVQNAKLQAQCSGSAHMLRLSLELAFGKGNASIIAGYGFSRNEPLTDLQHMQTVFRHNGMLYLLDATPPSSRFGIPERSGGLLSRANLRAMFTLKRDARPAMQQLVDAGLTSLEELVLDDARSIIEGASSLEELLGQQRSSLEQQLANIFRVSTSQLAKELAQRPQHDPSRRAIRLFAQTALRGAVDPAEIALYLNYLSNIEKGEPVTQRLGLPLHDPRHIRILRTHVQTLQTTQSL